RRVTDPAERAIGLAGLAVHAHSTGGPDRARRLTAAAMAALGDVSRYEWKFDRAAALDFLNRHMQTLWSAPGHVSRPIEQDSEAIMAYLLPDRRAGFEVALRCCLAETDHRIDMDSQFLRRAYRATHLCAQSQRYLDRVEPGGPWPTEAIAFHHEH